MIYWLYMLRYPQFMIDSILSLFKDDRDTHEEVSKEQQERIDYLREKI